MASRMLMPLSEQTKACQEQKDLRIRRKRVKQVASLIVVLVIALTCLVLSVPNVTPVSKVGSIVSIASSYIHAESLLPEDRELLSDVRTSIVPTSSIALPHSEMLHEPDLNTDFSAMTEIKADQTRQGVRLNELPGNEIVPIKVDNRPGSYRQRRNIPLVNLTSSSMWNSNSIKTNKTLTEELINTVGPTDEDLSDYEDEDLKSHSEQDLNIELDKNEDTVFFDSFQSFWKGEGDRNSIRKTQSEIMQRYMDTSVDPCVDFYQYACGNWANQNPIPADKAGIDTFEMLRENLDIVLKNLIGSSLHRMKLNEKSDIIDNNYLRLTEEKKYHKLTNCSSDVNTDIKDQTKSEKNTKGLIIDRNDELTIAEIKAIQLYESCMNHNILEKRGNQPLFELLKSLGGWPVIDPNWNESNFDWLELVAKLRLYNNDILISEWVGLDIKNSDEYVVQLDQTTLGLPARDYFLQNNNTIYLEAYKNYLTKVCILLGSSKENAIISAEELITFETRLAKITSPPDRRNVTELYQRLTLKELIVAVPKIDWHKYLTIVLNKNITLNETVVIFALKYMQDLVLLVEDTDSRVLSNYLLWRFIRHRVNNLDDRFQDAKQKFYYTLFGREEAPPRWKNCVIQVNSNMGMALGSMFVKKYFQESSKNDTFIMTREIQHSFKELLNINSWIDNETKFVAQDKVDSMMLNIGYPSFILKNDELNDLYKDVTIDPNNYFENTLNILQHLARMDQSKLGQVVNKTHWFTAPAIVNAYYSRNKNQIMLPAGILQPPFYHRFFPKCLNYGGIGVVIGHEITHGFDDKGRLFDKHGNLNRWWQDVAFETFYNKAQCLIDQYGLYTVSEVSMSLDGINTQVMTGENIADNGGVKQAFRAYNHWLKNHSDEDETLPGLNATNAQLFFLNFAQIWCGSIRPEAMKNKLKTGTHSPGKFRVIGTLSNSEDFAKVYNCPSGSPMNPIKKCNVW